MFLGLVLALTVISFDSFTFIASKATQNFGVISPPPKLCSSGESANLVRIDAFDCSLQPCAWFRGYRYEIGISFTPNVTSKTLAFGGKFQAGASNPHFGIINLFGSYLAGQTYRVWRSVHLPEYLPLGLSNMEVWLEDSNGVLINRCFEYTLSVW